MKWKLVTESDDKEVIPVELTTRELKLIQNYLTKGKPLNDPSNKECMEVVIRLLSELVDNSDIENLDMKVSNFLSENFGIEMEADPFGSNSSIPLADNGLIELKDINNKDFNKDGIYADKIQGGFWDEQGNLTNGFISIEDMNEVLANSDLGENEFNSVQLKQDGKVAKINLDI